MRTSPKRELVELRRSVRALQVPSGDEVMLEAGWSAQITQQLGSSFTVYIDGSLFRIDGVDADAIGKEPTPPKIHPENPTDDEVRAMVWEELREVYDPEIPFSIVELGLVYVCELSPSTGDGLNVLVQMTVTAAGCGMGEEMVREVAARLKRIPRVDDVQVELVFEPMWDRSMMSEAARLQLGLM
ncbi:MAG TPA: putative Fe-S cluster assembly protein SufT [Ramlibacter sp.]|nr:putative Fe-S cluster assembly protein SufT [Ramlibacter sp.]